MGTFNSNILPTTTGLDLGSPAQLWDAYLQSLYLQNSNGIRIADNFTGTDWAAKVTAADADLGSTPGEIWVSQAAGTLAAAAAPTLSNYHTLRFIQGGTYPIAVGWTITDKHDFAIIGSTGTVISFTGSSGFTITGTGLTNGSNNILLRDFAIDAPSASIGLHTIKMTRSEVTNVECRGVNGTAFVFDFSVTNTYTGLTASSNNGAFSHTPTAGLLLTNTTTASSNNAFISCKFEGINGVGITVTGSNANTFYGGTSEGNNGSGFVLSGTCQLNTLIGMDIESNTAGSDVLLTDGDLIRHTQLINMTVGRDVSVGTTSRETMISGGIYATVTIKAGAIATLLVGGVQYASLTDAGSVTNRIGENAATTNTLSVTKIGTGFTVDNSGPLTVNNIPYNGTASTATTFPLLWLTSADQTLVQYLATKAFKVRDNNGVDKFTVDDTAATSAANMVVTSSGAYLSQKRDITLANGANSDIALSGAGFAKIVGPTGVFSVSGFTGGTNGRILRLYNSVAFAMTITNNATSTAANRILTLTGADVVLRSGQSAATFIYDSTQSLWILISQNG